jgi:hypothetical protein
MKKMIPKFSILKSLFITCVCLCIALPSWAQKKQASEKSLWIGTYECENEKHPLMLKLKQTGNLFKGSFHALYQQTTAFQFTMSGIGQSYGSYYALNLKPKAWIEQAEDFSMIELNGKLGLSHFKGNIPYEGCGEFLLKRLDCENEPMSCKKQNLGVLGIFLGEDDLRDLQTQAVDDLQKQDLNQDDDQETIRNHNQSNQVNQVNQRTQRMPMSVTSFQSLIKQLSDSVSDKHRLEVLTLTVKLNAFSVKQVVKIFNEITFDDHKLEALLVLKGKITDLENVQQILDEFTFGSSKTKAMEILK